MVSSILSSTTVLNIDNIKVCCAAKQHISMISVESCDTEDWSNDAGNSALLYKNELPVKKNNNNN